MNKLNILIPFAIILLFSCDGKKKVNSAEVEALEKEDQSANEVLIENDYIKAIRVNLKPDNELPWHEGNERIVVPLNDYQVKFKKLAEGDETEETADKLFQKHVPNWYEEEVHSVVNTGKDTAKYLIVMRKEKSFPEENLYDKSELQEVENLQEVVLYDNPSVRVSRVKLNEGQEVPGHKGIYRLTYPLNDYSVVYDKENQKEEVRNIYEGKAHWHLPSKHRIENISNEGSADFLVFEFKI